MIHDIAGADKDDSESTAQQMQAADNFSHALILDVPSLVQQATAQEAGSNAAGMTSQPVSV